MQKYTTHWKYFKLHLLYIYITDVIDSESEESPRVFLTIICLQFQSL